MNSSNETYFMLLDESGDDGLIQDFESKETMANWFTTAGIIGHKSDIKKLEKAHNSIIKRYFTDRGIRIPPKFKLRHYEMKAGKGLHNKLTGDQQQELRKDMFETIRSSDCQIISTTVHKKCAYLENHKGIGVRALSLVACMEIFNRFLEKVDGQGEIIYEQFNTQIHKKTMSQAVRIQREPEFIRTKVQNRIRNYIEKGDPKTMHALSFADFVAYLSQSMVVKGGKSKVDWDKLAQKYCIDGCKIIQRGQSLGHHF